MNANDLQPEDSESQADLDDLLADFMRRLDQGEQLDHEAFIKAHPDLATELREYFSIAVAVERAAGSDGPLSKPTDRQSSATVAYTPSDAEPKADDFTLHETRTTQTGERFRKLRSHAKGGLGEVSLAHDEQLNRVVALKE